MAINIRKNITKFQTRENQESGITLVALVITIIVLLILAMVSIRLVINGGILDKAKTAVDKYSEGEIIEQIKLANQEYKMAQFTGTNLSAADYIRGRLEEIYENVTVTPKSETKNYPIIIKVNDFEYDVAENGNIDTHVDFETLETLYGKVVSGYTGYSATDVTEWKLLYIDEQNRDAFIISSNTLEAPQPTENGIPVVSNSGVSYTGSNNVASFEYGRKYNGLWLDQITTERTDQRAKATAFLCDPNNWNSYVTGKAKYAAGGPTAEIIVASVYREQISSFRNDTYSRNIKSRTTNRGYDEVDLTPVNSGYINEALYWIASPMGGGYYNNVRTWGENTYYLTRYAFTGTVVGLRPVVCLPASAIQINGTGDNITLAYK